MTGLRNAGGESIRSCHLGFGGKKSLIPELRLKSPFTSLSVKALIFQIENPSNSFAVLGWVLRCIGYAPFQELAYACRSIGAYKRIVLVVPSEICL